MGKLFLWFHNLAPGLKASITAVFAVLAFIMGAILESGVQRITGNQPQDVPWGMVWILISLGIGAAWGLLHFVYNRVLAAHETGRQLRERAITDARERITKLNVASLVRCDGIMENATVSIDELRSVLICDLDRIQMLITAAWDVVNSHHNISVAATERLNFEMTLITPSLEDSELTIASWCNRDSVRPKSLLMREKERDIYRKTEAYKMIVERTTETLVIEDTSAPKENYEQLYAGQKTRIRSCVLHPILSPKSEHLAVLVLHCDQAGFFRLSDRRYWRELLSVFAPSIALELERIRAFNKAVAAWPKSAAELYKPY
jgi:GAF domain-containing protein